MVTQVPIKSRKDESISTSCFQKMFKCTSSIYQIKKNSRCKIFQEGRVLVNSCAALSYVVVRGDLIKVNITSRPRVPTAKNPGSEPHPCLPGMFAGLFLTLI